jgi:hypothetical protein
MKRPAGIGKASKKTAQRERLVLAMLQQPTWQKAAEVAGVSEVTAWRIRHTTEFRREFLQARRELVSQCFARLQQGSSAAVATLLKIMCDANNSASSRVQAASRILDLAKGAFEVEDLEVRIQELEDGQQQANPQGAGEQTFGIRSSERSPGPEPR